jgi:putative inner membrane protein
MYILEEQTKELKEISETTFSEHGLKERYDLQEWIDKNPEILAKELGDEEELLIIQKEFSGFDKTNERLDLLALDKNGNLVIIENKLDDSGKDVTCRL